MDAEICPNFCQRHFDKVTSLDLVHFVPTPLYLWLEFKTAVKLTSLASF